MTIKIEKLSAKNQIVNPENSVFLKPEFREVLAREFRLEAIDISIKIQNQSVTIPAYRKLYNNQQRIIIGAGFDKTGDIVLPEDITFPDCINTLTTQLKRCKNPIATQLEVRSKHHIPGLKDHSDKVELVIESDLPGTEFMMKFSKYTRRNIRMPFKRGFHFEIGTQPHQLDEFYILYLKQIHQLGSLPHSYRFFRDLWEKCREDISLFIGYMDQQPVIAAFQLLSGHEVYSAWSGIHPEYKKHNLFLTMLWSIYEHTRQSGKARYNLGRSSANSGAYHFKKRLATQEQRIYYYVIDIKTGQTHIPRSSHNGRDFVRNSASWLIRHTPPQVMKTLSRQLIHRFY